VSNKFPFPFKTATSTGKITPPTSVHARPVQRPTWFSFSALVSVYFALPKKSVIFFLVMRTDFFFSVTIL
jgi:hypothetical protein